MFFSSKLYAKALELYAGEAVLERLKKYGAAGLESSFETLEAVVYHQSLQGMTTLAAHVTPEEIFRMHDQYFEQSSLVITRNGGTIVDFQGGSITAYWSGISAGSPAACRTAFDVQHALRMFSRQEYDGVDLFFPAVGLAAGQAYLANTGGSLRRKVQLAGATVNIAERLCEMNSMYGTEILAARAVQRSGAGDIYSRQIDRIRVRSSLEPEDIFELVAPRG